MSDYFLIDILVKWNSKELSAEESMLKLYKHYSKEANSEHAKRNTKGYDPLDDLFVDYVGDSK